MGAGVSLRTTELKKQMYPKYDFSGGVRGKYAKRFPRGRRAVVLDLDVAKVFQSAEEVNRALRVVARLVTSRRSRSKRLAS